VEVEAACGMAGVNNQRRHVAGGSAMLGVAYRGRELDGGGGCGRKDFGLWASKRGGNKQRVPGMWWGQSGSHGPELVQFETWWIWTSWGPVFNPSKQVSGARARGSSHGYVRCGLVSVKCVWLWASLTIGRVETERLAGQKTREGNKLARGNSQGLGEMGQHGPC